MTLWLQRARSRLLVFLHDMLMIPAAWGLAYWMRFNLAYVPPEFIEEAVDTLPLVVLVIGPVYWAFGLYRGVWRFASLNDLVRIALAVLVGTTLLLFVLFALNRMAYVPRSLPVLFVIFQLMLLAGPRLLYRWLKDRRLDFSGGQRVLIVGAGRAGEMLVRDLLRDRQCGYVPVAFVDDKPRRQGGVVHGVPIRGTTDDIPRLVELFGIDVVLLAVPSASAHQMQRLVELCEAAGRPFRTVPQTKELMAGRVAVNQLRAVSIEDLLGRDPVTLDWNSIEQGLAGRVVLVSGAGGSIGSELCRQLARCRPRRLILVDHSEYNLYRIETELLDGAEPPSLSRHLLDVTNATALDRLFERQRPDVVFHAAAYKHVPLLQDQVLAALANNVLGTRTIAAAADAWGCERFVLISTDKAVNPTNVMGATKRFAELICQDMQRRSACRFMTVRFGNVLGSAGSVVPRFQQQIERGGPLTVTHPEIERFFMTIPEACQLIMQAAVIGQGGETFVLDMGEPVKIRYLAEQMIRLSGREPGRDIRIEYTGLRPGEKLYEELFYPTEGFADTPHPRIHIARCAEALEAGVLAAALGELEGVLNAQDEHGALALLTRLVPIGAADSTLPN
ncbi:MAG: polysaccharide biosynthesis protein [Chromatiales bacterium]|nr:polysaccharide biosynthesis protein [Chromatiales bacterium]